MRNLVISFSGGETSAYMTHLLLSKYRVWYREVVVVFANTGQEMEAEYGLVGPEFAKKTVPGYRRTFFRGNQSVADLRELCVVDDRHDGCEEGCEVVW